MSYLPDSYKVMSGPVVPVQPPAKKTADLIEKETLYFVKHARIADQSGHGTGRPFGRR